VSDARRHFERLALPHLTRAYRLARQLAGPEKAEDLVQETFLRAWTHFDQFDPATNCRAWLLRILRNVWVSQWRKTRLELPVADVESIHVEPYYDWEGALLAAELSADMQSSLADLPEAYRWAVLLADVEDLTYQEIAGILDCPIGTVMSRINRGRRMLARLLLERRARVILKVKREAFWNTLGTGAKERYERYSTAASSVEHPTPCHHLNMIGTRRSHRGRGLARVLLQSVQDLADRGHSAGVTLNTEVASNVPLYEHLGYRVLGRTQVVEGLDTWTMFRPVRE
jgi:RNA polymerase sigma-70 factor (ECF subfamily)